MKMAPIGPQGVALLGGMAQLQQMWPSRRKCVPEVGSEVSNARKRRRILLSSCKLPIQMQNPPLFPAPCLPVSCHASGHADNGLSLLHYKAAPFNVFLTKSCHSHGVPPQQQRPKTQTIALFPSPTPSSVVLCLSGVSIPSLSFPFLYLEWLSS